MKIVTFSEGQSGHDWLAWRKNGIGSSDIGVINGSNPYKTPLQLWEIKCGFREEDPINAAMQHGITHEDIARQWINENFNLHLKPICVEDPEVDYFRASLDGFDFDHQVLVEIKCPVSESVLERARTSQAIPDYWIDQLQWGIMLTNPKRAIFALWDYRYEQCITLDMFGMTEQIQSLRVKAKAFWRHVQLGKPPEPSDKDYITVEDPQLHELLIEYKEIIRQEKQLGDRKKELKEQIIPFGKDYSFQAHGFKVKKMPGKGTYDMERMQLDGIDIDQYYKPSSSYSYRIMGG